MSIVPTIIDADVIINAVEINDRHGVGVLLQRIFQDRSRIISIRTDSIYGGEQSFGVYDVVIDRGLSRSEILSAIEKKLAGYTIRRILCIPLYIEEILVALAIQKLFGAEICTYLMDDRNISLCAIPDAVMSELLAKSALCLAISPEMRDVYRAKYSVPIYFAPPVIPSHLVNPHPPIFSGEPMGAIFGNIGSSKWLKLLRTMTRETGLQLDWYGNAAASGHVSDRQKLSSDGIIERGFLPTEAEVVEALKKYAYVVVPSGTLDLRDDNLATSWLSLPSRIPFVLATVNIPILVLGNSSTAAARFVEKWGIGTVADYDAVSFRLAVDRITQPAVQAQMRQNAAKIAPQLVNERMDEWIWQSLKLGKPVDDRFESLAIDPADYINSFTTCLDIIRQQQAEIDRLNALSRMIASPIGYLKQNSHRWPKIRRMWLRLKAKYAVTIYSK
jgi:hypothetical protein